MDTESPNRRVFVTEGGPQFQILSIAQSKADGSIYVSAPDFAEFKWVGLSSDTEGRPILFTLDSPGEGKLSLHGSGMATISPHESSLGHQLVVHGNYLLEKDKGGGGHLR